MGQLGETETLDLGAAKGFLRCFVSSTAIILDKTLSKHLISIKNFPLYLKTLNPFSSALPMESSCQTICITGQVSEYEHTASRYKSKNAYQQITSTKT